MCWPASTEPQVVLLHAAVVGRWSLTLFGHWLKNLGLGVEIPAYPNRQADVFGCADHLLPMWHRLTASTPGLVHLVGHSMGGLVARRLLHLHKPPNFGRLVTLGTPHLGSPLADLLHQKRFYHQLFGPVGQDLLTGRGLTWPAPWPPPYEIGLVAGSCPLGPGSFHLTRPHDGTVLQASALPDGGTDYALVPATHTTIPFFKKTAHLTANFLRTGQFLK